MPDKIGRAEALEIVTNALGDRVSGPPTQELLEALGVPPKVPCLPKSAVLDLKAEKLFIDGAEFPWYITEDGVDVSTLPGRARSLHELRFSIFAENLTVIPKGDQSVTDNTETTTK